MKKSDAEAVVAFVTRVTVIGCNGANEIARFMAKAADVPGLPGPPVQPTGDAQELAILRELHRRCEAQRVAFFYSGGTEPSAMMQSIYTQLDIYNVNFRKPQR